MEGEKKLLEILNKGWNEFCDLQKNADIRIRNMGLNLIYDSPVKWAAAFQKDGWMPLLNRIEEKINDRLTFLENEMKKEEGKK